MKTNKGNARSKGNESDDDQFSKQSWESKVNVQMEFDNPPYGAPWRSAYPLKAQISILETFQR